MIPSRKTIIITAVSILVLLVLGAGLITVVKAFDRSLSFPGFCTGSRFHHGGFHDEIKEFMFWRMDKASKKLNLNDSQHAGYLEFRNHIQEMTAHTDSKREAFKALIHQEMEKDTPDLMTITETVKVRGREMIENIFTGIEYFELFYQSLDENQKQTIMNTIREKMDQHCRATMID